MTNDYHFISNWRVDASIDEVAAILRRPAELPRWWPAVYLDVKVLEPGDADGVGQTVSLLTKGWLPYRLRWAFRVTESRSPHTWRLEAWGDLTGVGVWRLQQAGPVAEIEYDWRVRADKPLLRHGAIVFRPLFEANHRWAMSQGEASLKLELARRRASSSADTGQIPAPPGPTFPDNLRSGWRNR